MPIKNVKFKNGVTLLKNGQPVVVDDTFKIVQSGTLGTYGPDSDLVTQNDFNDFVIKKLAQVLGTGVLFTANMQYYQTNPNDLGKFGPYLPANYTVFTSSAAGTGTTQAIADAKALADARQKGLDLIALFAVVPSGSAPSSFTGLNANLLKN